MKGLLKPVIICRVHRVTIIVIIIIMNWEICQIIIVGIPVVEVHLPDLEDLLNVHACLLCLKDIERILLTCSIQARH